MEGKEHVIIKQLKGKIYKKEKDENILKEVEDNNKKGFFSDLTNS